MNQSIVLLGRPQRPGPRERIFQLGERRLSDAESLALILRTGGKGEPVEQLALRLLRQFGGLPGLADAHAGELAQVPGVGPVRAAAIAAAFGLARRLGEARLLPGVRVQGPADIARVVQETVRGARAESFFSILLDVRHRVLALQTISIGTLRETAAHPREVFASALRGGAAAVVVAHNHPSGDATPSTADRMLTTRLRQAGDLIGVELLDHVVVGSDRFYSFADESFFALP